MDEAVKILEKADKQERVVICARPDGLYTYRHQWAAAPPFAGAKSYWNAPGPECGIYDSPLTAETEARQRIDWLKDGFH